MAVRGQLHGSTVLDSSWNVMARVDARVGKWIGNWRMEWIASTLHATSEHGVSSINTTTTADAHTSAASSRLNWRPRRFKWTRPFRRKTKSCFCACAITFQQASTSAKRHRHPFNRRPRGPHSRSECYGQTKNRLTLQCIKPQFLGRPTRSLDNTPTTLSRLQDWTVALISRYFSFSTSFARWSLCPIVIQRRRGCDVRPLQYFDHQGTSRQNREILERGQGYQQLQCDTPIHSGWQSFITFTHEGYV